MQGKRFRQIRRKFGFTVVVKFHNTIIFSSSDTILAQHFLGIPQNQCFALQRQHVCNDIFSTLVDEFGSFEAVFGAALNKRNQAVGYKKHGISACRKEFLLF